MIGFGACDGIHTVRKYQRTAFSFDIFRVFNSDFSLFDGMICSFKVIFASSAVGGALDFQKNDFGNCIAVMIVRLCQNATNSDNCLSSNSYFQN